VLLAATASAGDRSRQRLARDLLAQLEVRRVQPFVKAVEALERRDVFVDVSHVRLH
jgi:hypothetical protein